MTWEKRAMTSHTDRVSEDRYWQVLVERDAGARSAFVYGVCSTGIFCRPGCPSRLPRKENVEFFPDAAAAEKAGYRPCRRCAPDKDAAQEEQSQKVIGACRLIEASDEPPELGLLAERAGMSRSHFHRLFKKIVGVTPKQYGRHWRTRRFQALLKKGEAVTEALYGAGYGSSSGPYRSVEEGLAMAPRTYRDGGRGEILSYGIAQCFLGWLIVVATDKGVCAVEFGDNPEVLVKQQQQRFSLATLIEGDRDFHQLVRAVVSRIHEPAGGGSIPLDIRGTVFELKVWNALRRIPPGSTVSYSELAERIGRPRSVRAVAGACGRNRLGGLIPCHRVVAKDGSLAGYRWGLERKRQLLAAERLGQAGDDD
jgi:AraC family transcriptional regulator, regulatory protein of adaptative response / methylated-DNA-[protein]-cysteine methyltransferase